VDEVPIKDDANWTEEEKESDNSDNTDANRILEEEKKSDRDDDEVMNFA
jgi:hypothetical protein